MAIIDLRNVTIVVQDGYEGGTYPFTPWLVNNSGGYSAAATTMTVDGGTGPLADGDQFTVAGETGTPTHTISAHSESLGNTTSITFTPGLAGSVADDAVITVLPHHVAVHIGEGNMTYSEKRKIKYVTDRGILNTVKLEEDQPLEAKLAYEWDFLTSSIAEGVPTIEDVFKFRNLCSGWVSTSPDKCEIKCVDIVLLNTPPCNGVSAEQIVLSQFRWEDLAHDPKAGTVDVTGKCNTLTALVSRIPT